MRIAAAYITLLLWSTAALAQPQDVAVVNPIRIKESVVTAKIPKKLHTFVPFWGTPLRQDSGKQQLEWTATTVMERRDSTSLPRWVCWNLDLASVGAEKFKYEAVIPKGIAITNPELLGSVINECYKWAWRKPYGRTNVVWGPMYHPKGGDQPYAFFVAVCKEERVKGHLPLGYTSVAFIVPNYPITKPAHGIYDLCTSVNAVEYKTGYNLFPKLPAAVQERVEEYTDYELFCPFQEIDDAMLDYLEVEFDRPNDSDDGPVVIE